MASDSDLTLGEFLRQEREKRGMTIEQVASATKIGVKQLHALESDKYGELPAKPFVRGFVTSYSRFIGIDPREVLTRFNEFIEQRSHDRPNRDAGHSGYAFEKREGEQSRTVLGIVMVVLAVLGIIVILLKPGLRKHRGSHVEKLRSQQSAHPSPSPAPSPLSSAVPSPTPTVQPLAAPFVAPPIASPVASPAPVAVPLPSPSFSPAAPVPEPSEAALATPSPSPTIADPLNSGVGLKPAQIKHKVLFKALESVWVRYRADERPMMVFVLRKDRILVLRAERNIIFQTAHPEALVYNYNNQGYRSLTQSKSLALRQSDSTLFIPSQLSEITPEPFPGERSLSTRPRPLSASASPTPSPSP
ncbi:MAG: helix-turn-helix domain-containing protein [Oligoflexia bacterium]|nr:helix-turn-helix domain-containing protein [Oligoflexia bacterium]